MIVLHKNGKSQLFNEFSYEHLLEEGWTLDPNEKPQAKSEKSLEKLTEEAVKETDEALAALEKVKKKAASTKAK